MLEVSFWPCVGAVPTAAGKQDGIWVHHKGTVSISTVKSRLQNVGLGGRRHAMVLCLILLRLMHLIRGKSQILRTNFWSGERETERKESSPISVIGLLLESNRIM